MVLVEPEEQGNIGAVARAMHNFGLSRLIVVNPKEKLGEEAWARAKHAKHVLERAEIVPDLYSAIEGFDFVVGTTGTTIGDKNPVRTAVSPKNLSKIFNSFSGSVAMLFGREGSGLTNEELSRCDLVVSIPANPEYPILNVSHAAAIIFYELYQEKDVFVGRGVRMASRKEKERIIANVERISRFLGYPEHREKLLLMIIKRLMGRQLITGREAYTIIGFTRRIANMLQAGASRRGRSKPSS